MQTEISFEIAQERHPEKVKQVIAKLRKGKSQHRNAEPSQLSWVYHWGVEIPSGRVSTYLCGRIGRWGGSSDRLSKTPPEVVNIRNAQIKEQKKEEARIQAMSPEERTRTVQECIRKLSKYPGFAVFGEVK